MNQMYAMIDSQEANNNRNLEISRKLIESYIEPRTLSRNARLALLRYCLIQTLENTQAQEKLFSACREYFMEYRTKIVCFRDLQPYVSRLERPLQEKLLGLVARDTKDLVCSDRAPQVRILPLISLMVYC